MSANNVVEQPGTSSETEHELHEMSHIQQNNGNSKARGQSDANEPRNDVGSACSQWDTGYQEKQSALGKLRERQPYDDEDLEEFETFQYDSYDVEAYNKAKEKYVFFWKSHDIYSQWNTQRKFYVNRRQFNCAEQFMMYEKAVMFNDWKIAEDILWCKNPRKMKALGREVKGFDEKIWTQHCLYIVKEGNTEKFTQNEDFLADLLLTYPKLLVEASPYDKIWGIGLEEHQHEAWDESTWDGKNYLGYVLTEVRDDIMVARGMIDEKERERHIERLLYQAGYDPMSKSVENTPYYSPDNEEYLLFSKGMYHQWYHSIFEVGKTRFNSAEQYMMYRKAVLFQDRSIAQQILKCDNPKQIKALGRKVKGFDEKTWEQHCLQIVKKGNLAKFQQNERLRMAIITTYPKIFAEANPHDDVWGIGLAEDNPNARNKEKWRGWNCLGYILTEVRDEILFESGLIKKDKVAKYIDKLHAEWGTPVGDVFQHDKKDKNTARNEKYIPGLHAEMPAKNKKGSKTTDIGKNYQKERYIPGLHVETPAKHKKYGKTTDNEKDGRKEKYIPGLHVERPATDKSINRSGLIDENQRSMDSEHNAGKTFVNHGGQNAKSNIRENDALEQHSRGERKEEGKNKVVGPAKVNDKRANENEAARGINRGNKDIDQGKTELNREQVETMSKTQRKKLEKAQRQSESQNNHDEDDNNGGQASPVLSLRQKKNLKKKLKKGEEQEQVQEMKGKKGKKGKK